MLSNRGAEWKAFSEQVMDHIEKYTVLQYGDAPNDQVENWTPEECVLAIKKYCARFRKNYRIGQDELDLKKVAHYACLALAKISKETENTSCDASDAEQQREEPTFVRGCAANVMPNGK